MKSLSLFLVAALAAPAAAQPRTETLTLQQAIELALQQHPSVKQTRASIESAEARIQSAKVAQRPTFNVQASLSESSSRAGFDTVGNPTGGFFDPRLSTGLSASASWRIYDFGQTSANIRAAELAAEATVAGLGTTTLDIRVRVASAYLEAIARTRLITVAQATVISEDQHLDQARRFVAAQAKDPIEVVQAQARAANARSALAQAQSNAALALANLRSAIGFLDPSVTFTVEPGWPTPPSDEPPQLDVLVTAARQSRPEITVLDKRITAAEAEVTAAKAQRRPVLSASANTLWGPNQDNWTPQPSWTAGLTLSWQLYDGGRSAANARVARAGVLSAEAERDALLVSLTSELDAARQQIVAHRANVAASNEAVTAARAQLKLADARYTQGLGSQIELADAQTAVTTAEGNLITAEWQLADAWTNLRRSLGQP